MDAKATECTAHVAALQHAHAVELQNLAQQYEARLDTSHVSARDDRAEAQAILEDMLRRVRDAVPLTELCACHNEEPSCPKQRCDRKQCRTPTCLVLAHAMRSTDGKLAQEVQG